jgi:hypothetical protein
MGRCLWQESDEGGDFGRFPVKKRSPFVSFFWACWPIARLPRRFLTRRRGDSGRGERLRGLSAAVVALNDTRSRGFARIFSFQLAIGAMFGTAGESRKILRPLVVHGDRSYGSGFESVRFIGRLLSTA